MLIFISSSGRKALRASPSVQPPLASTPKETSPPSVSRTARTLFRSSSNPVPTFTLNFRKPASQAWRAMSADSLGATPEMENFETTAVLIAPPRRAATVRPHIFPSASQHAISTAALVNANPASTLSIAARTRLGESSLPANAGSRTWRIAASAVSNPSPLQM